MKPPLRTKSVGTKVSEAEYALLEERARGAGMRLAEWVREALLSAPVGSGVDSGEVALGEVLALRSLLLNLHFRAAKGEAIPEPDTVGRNRLSYCYLHRTYPSGSASGYGI